MKKSIIVLVALLFLSGCTIARHSGKVEIFNAKGEPAGSYVATLDRPMMIEVTDPNGVIVKADSRGVSTWGQFLKGMMEMVTIGLLVD